MRRTPAPSRGPLLVVLLPSPLERMPQPEALEALLQAPGAIAVEPAHVSYAALARLPAASARSVARRQARRMRLPGVPTVIAALHPLQVPLALALLERHRDAELWYGARDGAAATPRELELDAAARERAAATLVLPVTAPLWTRMESRGIESGRLGSERLSS